MGSGPSQPLRGPEFTTKQQPTFEVPTGFYPGPNDSAGPSANRSKEQTKFTHFLIFLIRVFHNGLFFTPVFKLCMLVRH